MTPFSSNIELNRAVDLGVVKSGSGITTETETRDDFHTRLLEHNDFCVFTGFTDLFTEAIHIIPLTGVQRCGSETFL
jgi:hypothetical protein